MAVPKISANRGDVAEVILAASVSAKFYDRPAKDNKTPWIVTQDEVESMVKKILKNGRIVSQRQDIVKVDSKVKGKITLPKGVYYKEVPTIIDEIKFSASVPAPAWNWLKDNTNNNWKDVHDLFASSILYVNNHKLLADTAKKIAVNAKVDEFLVAAAGTEDQTGTKVDIKMTLNNKRISTQISLKVKGGDQFAQVSGPGFEKQLILWKDGLGLNINKIKSEYDRTMKKFDYGSSYSSREDDRVEVQKEVVKKATKAVFEEAATLMNSKFKQKNVRANYYKKIITFIKEGAAGQETEFIELVKLEGCKYKRVIFNNEFDNAINELNLVAKVRPHGDPLLYIDDETSGNPLIQIRMKVATESSKVKGQKVYRVYPRTIIEAPTKSIMYSLLS